MHEFGVGLGGFCDIVCLTMISRGGVSCCLGAFALYCLGHRRGREAAILRSVKRVSQLRDLALLLDTACEVLPLVVSVVGRVGSETPIKCQNSSLRCVILEETAEQHFLKHSDAGWIPDSALMLPISKEVPWYLEDGTGSVYVVGARGARGLELTVASEVFEESGQSPVRGTLDYLQGLKMLGVKRVEKVLPTGTALTVVGEAMKDDIGTIRVQKPRKGPFYVSPKSIDQLIANLGKWARWYKFASLGLTIFGLYLMTTHAIRHIMERRRHREWQRRVRRAAAQRREQNAHEGVQNDAGSQHDHDVKRDNPMPALCIICLEQEYNVVFVPCGHMCCCTSCSSRLSECPLCRRHIEQVVRTYRH